MKMSRQSKHMQKVGTVLSKPHVRMAFTVACCTMIYPTTAHAYIDPGSGSVVMSTLLGIAAAVAYTFKKYFYKIKRLFRKGAPLDDDTSLDGADKK